MSKIALITGITGQDGSYLAELLLKKKYVVHGFLREQNREKATKNLWRIKKNLQSLKLHRVNSENEDKIKRLLNLIKPDEIYHLAAQAYDGHSFDNEFYTIETNLNYTHKILSLSKKANLNTKFFFAGSSEMYSKDIKTKSFDFAENGDACFIGERRLLKRNQIYFFFEYALNFLESLGGKKRIQSVDFGFMAIN